MMVVGITGGIGSGKTTVCNVFRQLGVPVYESDSEAKKLYETEPEICERIKKEISSDVFDKKGKLDKQKLSAHVFKNDSELKKLNKIVHPYVIRNFMEWTKQHKDVTYVLNEAAILFESGTNEDCDRVITISAPAELRISRIVQRDKRSKDEIELIMKNQWSDEDKIKKSDYVIVNDEHEMVIPQIIAIHNKLVSLK